MAAIHVPREVLPESDLTVFFLWGTVVAAVVLLLGVVLAVRTHRDGFARATSRTLMVIGVLLVAVCGLPALFFGV